MSAFFVASLVVHALLAFVAEEQNPQNEEQGGD
jgi:hypothetical protein